MPGLYSVEGEGVIDGELRVYIAGPYTSGRWGPNIEAAIDAAQDVYEAGHVPFVPHTMTALWSMKHMNDWITFDLKWVEVCDALVRIGGWSEGAQTEEEFAKENGIPVYHGVDDFIDEVGENV